MSDAVKADAPTTPPATAPTPPVAASAMAVVRADPAAATPHSLVHPIWLGFRRFRRTRPFWGAVILLFGAYCIANPIVGGGFNFVADVGTPALTPLLLAFGMGAAALVAMFQPAQRHFPAIVAMGLSVASLPLANLGGWIIGMAAGIIGSGMIFAWAPYSDQQRSTAAAKAQRKGERKARRSREAMPGPAHTGARQTSSS